MAEPEPERDPTAWQHEAINHAKAKKWEELKLCVLPPGEPRMPDDLLNSLPGERKMTVLHQMAYNGGDHGVEPALRALVAGGCRFDPGVRTPMSADPAERNMNAPQIARDRGHAHIAELMSQLPDLAQQTKWRYKDGEEWLPFTANDAAIEKAWDDFRLRDAAHELTVQESGRSLRVDLLKQRAVDVGGGSQPMRIKRSLVAEEAADTLIKVGSKSLSSAPANFPKGLPAPEDPGAVTQFYWHGEEDDSWIAYEEGPNAALVAGFLAWKGGGGSKTIECAPPLLLGLCMNLQAEHAVAGFSQSQQDALREL